MELHIDSAIKSKYDEYHAFYVQNFKIFRNVLKVFESFFKKEKFQNSEVKLNEEARDAATIQFCSKKYQLALYINPADLNAAKLILSKARQDQWIAVGEVRIDRSENMVFPDQHKVSARDENEFNDAVLKFFITSMTRNAETEPAVP